jgi:LAO/AO transport system kinase
VPEATELVQGVLQGDRLALARTLSQVENGTPVGQEVLNALFVHTGRAHLVGVTGSPGSGKSTLVNQLARYYRQPPEGEAARRVAVVAVDPTSPFTGGAILGDRIRMRDLAGDPGVFIRSMASRGSLGGIAATTAAVVQVFDAAGFEMVLIETVGVGQAEVDIARLAHTTLVVEAPGMGDDIQAIKAGILEVADVLVVNKADHPGAASTERALRGMLELAHPVPKRFSHHGKFEVVTSESAAPTRDEAGWIPPILRTVATEGSGVAELAQVIDTHRTYLERSGGWKLRERLRLQAELDMLLQERLVTCWKAQLPAEAYAQTLEAVLIRQLAPHQAVQRLVKC